MIRLLRNDSSVLDATCTAQNRSIQKYLVTSSKHNVLVQYEARSGERIVILSNTITRDRLPQHTTCDLY